MQSRTAAFPTAARFLQEPAGVAAPAEAAVGTVRFLSAILVVKTGHAWNESMTAVAPTRLPHGNLVLTATPKAVLIYCCVYAACAAPCFTTACAQYQAAAGAGGAPALGDDDDGACFMQHIMLRHPSPAMRCCCSACMRSTCYMVFGGVCQVLLSIGHPALGRSRCLDGPCIVLRFTL